jgi:hypothetical protein
MARFSSFTFNPRVETRGYKHKTHSPLPVFFTGNSVGLLPVVGLITAPLLASLTNKATN